MKSDIDNVVDNLRKYSLEDVQVSTDVDEISLILINAFNFLERKLIFKGVYYFEISKHICEKGGHLIGEGKLNKVRNMHEVSALGYGFKSKDGSAAINEEDGLFLFDLEGSVCLKILSKSIEM